MSITANSFFKTIPVTISSGEATAGTLTRTYNDRVENTNTIIVYYNGQVIANDTGIGSPTDKYYYTTVRVAGTAINSTALITGHYYKITTAGSTTWTTAGAADSVVGTIFIASGTADGSGVAEDLNSGATTAFDVFANTSYRGPGYVSGSSTYALSTFDTVMLSYYYVVYTS
jgi:hypothetical protein